jgi:hypothetical protein
MDLEFDSDDDMAPMEPLAFGAALGAPTRRATMAAPQKNRRASFTLKIEEQAGVRHVRKKSMRGAAAEYLLLQQEYKAAAMALKHEQLEKGFRAFVRHHWCFTRRAQERLRVVAGLVQELRVACMWSVWKEQLRAVSHLANVARGAMRGVQGLRMRAANRAWNSWAAYVQAARRQTQLLHAAIVGFGGISLHRSWLAWAPLAARRQLQLVALRHLRSSSGLRAAYHSWSEGAARLLRTRQLIARAAFMLIEGNERLLQIAVNTWVHHARRASQRELSHSTAAAAWQGLGCRRAWMQRLDVRAKGACRHKLAAVCTALKQRSSRLGLNTWNAAARLRRTR